MLDGYFDRGVVLGTVSYKDSDRLVSILTENHGLVRYLARGVRRQGSKKAPHLDLFQIVRFQTQRGEGVAQLLQVESQSYFLTLKKDFQKVQYCLVIAEILNNTVASEVVDKEIFVSMCNYLEAIDKSKNDKNSGKISREFAKYLIRHLGYPEPKSTNSVSLSEHFESIMNRKIISSQIR